MGGAAGGGGMSHAIGGQAHSSHSAEIVAARAHFDEVYGPDWRERTLKTLEQELKERGIDPRSGDDGYQVVPTPRLMGGRVALGMLCVVVAFLGLCACWAWWEYLPDDSSPFYTQRTR